MKTLLSIIVLLAIFSLTLTRPALAADPANGAKVFSANCAACHLPWTAKAKATTVVVAPMNAMEFFKVGVDESRSEKYERAIEDFTQAIELDTDFSAAYNNRCLAYIQLGNYAKAIEDCSQALQLKPDNVEANLNRGLAYYRIGNYQAAISNYAQVIELRSDDVRAYYNRGLARFALKDYQGAIADYNQALDKAQQSSDFSVVEVYNDRGLAQLMLENVPDAIADFSLAINLDTSNYRAFYNRACACHQNADYRGAIRDLTLALQLDPNHAEAFVSRGLIHHELGLQQAALSDLRMALKRFNEQHNTAAYQHTLALIGRLQYILQSFDESVIS